MKQTKRKKLESKGWRFGTPAEFLGLSDGEAMLLEVKLALAKAVKDKRTNKRLSQTSFARVIESSQSRVAKMEAGDPSVSIDLLVKSMIALGASQREIAKAIASPHRPSKAA